MTREEAIGEIDDFFAGENDIGIYEIIDKIYDDFESRKCENCKHFTNTYYNLCACAKNVFIEYPDDNEGVEEAFSCNKFERKEL